MKVNISTSMGRPLPEMLQLVSSVQDVVQEHLWKLFAYHLDRPNDVSGWKKSLDKYIPRLQTYNVQKGNSTRKNLDRRKLIDKFVTELFEDGDIDLLVSRWEHADFPYVEMTPERRVHLRKFASKFVDTILGSAPKMEMSPSDLI